MKVFSIEGRFQQDGHFSNLPADFTGYFVLEEGTRKIRGYTKEHYDTTANKERYIYGNYYESEKKLVFLKLSTDKEVVPLLYNFLRLGYYGWWSAYSYEFGDFYTTSNQKEGLAEVTIKEVTTMKSDDIIDIYNKVIEDGGELNMELIERGVDAYIDIGL